MDRLALGAIGRENEITYIGTERGHERLNDTILHALAVRHQAILKTHLRLLRVTVGAGCVIVALMVWIVVR